MPQDINPPESGDSRDRVDREALTWFVRRQCGLDAHSEGVFQRWCAADPVHQAALDRWAKDWQALDALPADAVCELRERLARDTAGSVSAQQSHTPWRMAWGRACALAASACVVVAGGLLAWSHWQQQPVFVQSIATGRGQQSEVHLPDGSTVRLDTATRLEVTLYRHRREVRLPEGQAVFEVRGDVSRPFDVLAGPVRITVVGTRFAVRHTPGMPGEEGVRVAVEEGRVRVAAVDSGGQRSDAVELGAGQQVASDAAGQMAAVTAVPSSGIALWRGNRISFDNVPLRQVLAEFSRYGNPRLTVRDPAVAALRLSGTFDPRRLDNFIRVLPGVLPIQLRERDQTTEIVAAP